MLNKDDKNMRFTDKRLLLLLLILNYLLLNPAYSAGYYIFPDEISHYSENAQFKQNQYNRASSLQAGNWTYPQYVTDFNASESVNNKKQPLYKNVKHYSYPEERSYPEDISYQNKYRYSGENDSKASAYIKNKAFRFSKPIYPSDLEPAKHIIQPRRYKDDHNNRRGDRIDHSEYNFMAEQLPHHIPNTKEMMRYKNLSPNILYNDAIYNGFSSKTDDKFLDLDQLFPRAERIIPPF